MWVSCKKLLPKDHCGKIYYRKFQKHVKCEISSFCSWKKHFQVANCHAYNLHLHVVSTPTLYHHKQPQENIKIIHSLYEISPPSMPSPANKHVWWSPLLLTLAYALVIELFCKRELSHLFDFDKTDTGTVECLDNTWN